jgi:dTDP-glucose pyrophosphorylase
MPQAISNLCLQPDETVADAARILEQNPQKICFVVKEDVLLGTITDGDIRRSLLQGVSFDGPAEKIMNANPRTAFDNSDRDELRALMTELGLLHVPIITSDRHLCGLITLDELMRDGTPNENWVVLMAGGLGERLRPLTENTPKPLLQIGDKPLLQSILESFIEQNFRNFFIAVNFKASAIKDHFDDGSAWGVNIRYLEEKERMGTAGALTLLPSAPSEPVIVMNGDLVTRTSFQDLLDFHAEQKSRATMCVREYDFQVPFGVISIEDNRITAIDEKPLHRFFVNAGIYVLEPDVIASIPINTHSDMTQVFEQAIAEQNETAVFPIHEYWLDIGRIDDLERAKSDFKAGHDT